MAKNEFPAFSGIFYFFAKFLSFLVPIPTLEIWKIHFFSKICLEREKNGFPAISRGWAQIFRLEVATTDWKFIVQPLKIDARTILSNFWGPLTPAH